MYLVFTWHFVASISVVLLVCFAVVDGLLLMACGGNITCLLLSYTNSEQVSPKKWDQFQSAYDCCERRMEMRSVKDAPNG